MTTQQIQQFKNTLPIHEIKIGNRFRKDEGDLTGLIQSIKECGLLHPIVVSPQGELIAGYRRVKAFEALNLREIPVSFVDINSDYDLKRKERDENEIRKNFTVTEAVAVKRYFENEVRAQAQQNSLSNLKQGNKHPDRENFHLGKSRDILGSYVGMSGKTLQIAEKIVTAAESNPKFQTLIDDVDKGKISITNAHKKIEQQLQREKILSKTPIPKIDKITLINDDFRKVTSIQENSVNCIIVDPPYGEEYLELWDGLAELAKKVLIPSGYLITYSGHQFLPQIYSKLSQKLEYFWTASLTLKNRNLINHRNIYSLWKPLLIFCKSPMIPPAKYFNDLINGNGREKEYHEWQQGIDELENIITTFCPNEGLILDPMAGSGTTLLAAKKLGHKSIGIELNKEKFEIMQRRLSL